MAVVDLAWSFPGILIALILGAIIGVGLTSTTVASLAQFTRLTRARIVGLERETFVEATLDLGASPAHVLPRRLLPNATAPVIVVGMLAVGDGIVLEATPGFFGPGAQLPTPSWRATMPTGTAQLFPSPWASIFPGVVVAATVIAVNLLGDEPIRAPDLREGPGGLALHVRDLVAAFATAKPLSSVAFSLEKGRMPGVVGASGSGKPLTATSVVALLALIGGRVSLGVVLLDGREPACRRPRGGRTGLSTPNPMTSLDPVEGIGPRADTVARLRLGVNRRAARARRPMPEEAGGGRADMGPVIALQAAARAFEARRDVLVASVDADLPCADVAEVGPTVLVVHDGEPEAHRTVAEDRARDICARRRETLDTHLGAAAAARLPPAGASRWGRR